MRLIIQDEFMEHIPTTHYTCDDDTPRQLLVVCHGFKGERHDVADIALSLARHGYYVVTLDAFMHGERVSKLFSQANDQEKGELIFDIIYQTTDDIKQIIQMLEMRPHILCDEVGITGVSMGGMTAHLVAATHEKVSVVADMIGTPDYLMFLTDLLGGEALEAYADKVEIIRQRNPITLYQQQTSKAILCCHGRSDEVVPINGVNQSYKTLATHYKAHEAGDRVKYMKYFCKHETPSEMKRMVYRWFLTHLKPY